MIIFMGVAGSGKSVQGRKLADELQLPWLSTGEFLRMLIAGEKRKDMLAGKLLKDQEIIAMVRKVFTIIDTDQEFILDGFPRTVGQADWLINQAKHGQLHITAIIHLSASGEIVKGRLLGRGRQDDTEAAIHERFKEFEDAIKPILEHFKLSGVDILEVNGELEEHKVHEQIVAHLRARDVHAS